MHSNSQNSKTPNDLGLRQPAEWERHEACWLAWPSAADLWKDNLASAQAEFTELCKAIGASEKLNILVNDKNGEATAFAALGSLKARFFQIPFGDIWLRDTAPIFLKSVSGERHGLVQFKFNGWGEKYILPHDDRVSDGIAQATHHWIGHPATHEPHEQIFLVDAILEGGSVDVDGEGACLTTEQCLLNKNRNPKMNRAQTEKMLLDSLGASKVLWLKDGLINDHTDGHIDTLARFVAPGEVMCMTPAGADDPNKSVFETIIHDLKNFKDAKGRELKVWEVPSPGKILNDDNEIMPASYMNFYISNSHVIVPIYGSKNDDLAVKKISEAFPTRKTIGLSARVILTGGGAFHCITQQVPK